MTEVLKVMVLFVELSLIHVYLFYDPIQVIGLRDYLISYCELIFFLHLFLES